MIINRGSYKFIFCLLALALTCFGLGCILGLYISLGDFKSPLNDKMPTTILPTEIPSDSSYEDTTVNKWEAESDLIQTILTRINAQSIKDFHSYLTKEPHVAGGERDDELAIFMRDRFAEYSFDVAELVPYNILLSAPDADNPNKIRILNEDNEVMFESIHVEPPVHSHDNNSDLIHAFIAYTPAGTVTTERGYGLVYVNYGRIEDFDELKQIGVNVTGHIVVCRYGKLFRGDKVKNAQDAGAIGMILYSNPEEVAAKGTGQEDTYPNNLWIPSTGMQRGTTHLGVGDPLTPGWASTENAFRIDEKDANLPKIPVQPIGYGDALKILELLGGPTAPEDWQGGYENFTYKIGPRFVPEYANMTVTLSTHNKMTIARSYNVIGVIKGAVEPDRYVMIGNHRDAWGHGAVDSSSGNAQILETARVFGTLIKEGWRPRRTMIFHSWGAEEFGAIGSQEWVEENIGKVQDRTVAYINSDVCATGPMFHAYGSPLLWDAIYEITSLIPGVSNLSMTVYDEWKSYQEKIHPHEEILQPPIGGLGAGSDYSAFANLAGIPAMRFWFRKDRTVYDTSMYPAYHTGYDTFHMFSELIDPGYKITQACGRVAALTLKFLADSAVIPYSITRMPEKMQKILFESPNRDKLKGIYDKYTELENSIARLIVVTEDFVAGVNVSNLRPLELRTINDQLMQFEQTFTIPEGLPGRPYIKHAVFAPSQFDQYASDGFPGISDLLYGFDELQGDDKTRREVELKRHISDLTILTDRAASLLEEVHRL